MEGNVLAVDVKDSDQDYLFSRGDIPDPVHGDEDTTIDLLLSNIHDEYPEVSREVIKEAYENKGKPVAFTPEAD